VFAKALKVAGGMVFTVEGPISSPRKSHPDNWDFSCSCSPTAAAGAALLLGKGLPSFSGIEFGETVIRELGVGDGDFAKQAA